MIIAYLILAGSVIAALCSAVKLASALIETWLTGREIARLAGKEGQS